LRSSINSVLVDNKINNQNRVGAKTPGGRFQEIECKITMGAVWLVLLEGGIGSICSWNESTWIITWSNGDNNDVKIIAKTKAIKNVP